MFLLNLYQKIWGYAREIRIILYICPCKNRVHFFKYKFMAKFRFLALQEIARVWRKRVFNGQNAPLPFHRSLQKIGKDHV